MSSQWEAQVIGINYYTSLEISGLKNLTAAANDAESVATKLEGYGYEAIRVQRLPRKPNPDQKGEWLVNTDEVAVKAQELKAAITNIFNPPAPSEAPELGLLFFSGHGWRKKIDGEEKVFLATSDVFPEGGDYGVALSWVAEQLQKSPVQKIIVWLDCCYSGELFKYIDRGVLDSLDKDYCFITATRSYEPGIEIRHQQGLFTQVLLEGLDPSRFPEGIVDSHKLVNYIQGKMEQTGQAPQMICSKITIPLTIKFPKRNFQDKCPYRSLSSFSEKPEDALVFYGRTKLTLQLIERVRNQERLIVVFGQSGSGKSSLLRAGLLYQLKLGQIISGSNNWTFLGPITPGDFPLERLRLAFREKLGRTHEHLPIILIIDQFEECFTMCDEGYRHNFIQKLNDLRKLRENLLIILGMRSDFRSRLREYPEFTAQMIKFNVENLNREEIREAIEKPAQWVGLGIEGKLQQQLINDVEDYPGSLPLLQYTLTELWKEARAQQEKFLRLETYEELGGIEGTLEKRADEVYASLSEDKKQVARRIFLELTQIGNIQDTRRKVSLEALVNSHHSYQLLDNVTDFLANENNRLITKTDADSWDNGKGEDGEQDAGTKDKILDVVHEALIRNWGKLRAWQDEYRDGMVVERKIEAAAEEWLEKGKKSDYLLQGDRLAEAQNYIKDYGYLGMLDGIGEDFIAASQNLKEQQKKEEEEEKERKRKEELEKLELKRQYEKLARKEAEKARRKAEELAKKEAEKARREAEKREIDLEARRKAEELARKEAEKARREAAARAKVQLKANKKLRILSLVNVALTLVAGFLAIGFFVNGKESYYKQIASDINSNLTINKEIEDLFKSIDLAGDNKKNNNIWFWLPQRWFKPINKLIPEVQSVFYQAVDASKNRAITTFKGHQGSVRSVAFSPDGQYLLSGSDDETLKLWDRQSQSLVHTFEGHQGSVRSVAFSPDGQYLLSGSFDGTLKLWDRQSQSLFHTFEGHQDNVTSVAFSPDGRYLLSGSGDGTLKLWYRKFLSLVYTFKGHQDYVTSVSFSPDGKYLVSGSGDGTLKLWDVEQQELVHTFEGHQDNVTSVAFSPDGHYLLGSSAYGTLKLWDRKFLSLVYTFEGHQDYVNSVAFSPDGQYLLSGSDDGTLKLWDRQSQSLVYTFIGHQDYVTSVAFSPDGRYLLSGSGDGTLKLWDRQSQSLVYTFEGHQDYVNSVAFSPDGRYLLSGSRDGTLKLWLGNNWQGWVEVACKRERLHPTLIASKTDSAQGAAKTCIDYGNWTKQEKAEFLVKQGFSLAKDGDAKQAKRKLQRAYQLDPDNVKLAELETQVDQVAYQVAYQLDAQELIKEGMSIAKRVNLYIAQEKFQQAYQLDPDNVKLAELKTQARQLAAQALVEKGIAKVRQGNVTEAIALYKQAQEIEPYFEIDANVVESWNKLCWFGSIYRYAAEVFDYCEKAMIFAKDEESKTRYFDSRGLARALTGDIPGAIKDFQTFLDSPGGRAKDKRKLWIELLKKGEDPFTDEVLEDLKYE